MDGKMGVRESRQKIDVSLVSSSLTRCVYCSFDVHSWSVLVSGARWVRE